MIQPGNYSSNAIEFITKMIGTRSIGERFAADTETDFQCMRNVLKLLKDSIKFLIPLDADLGFEIPTEQILSSVDLIKLPYHRIAIEYPVFQPSGIFKKIDLCVPGFREKDGYVSLRFDQRDEFNGIAIISLEGNTVGEYAGSWMINDQAMWIGLSDSETLRGGPFDLLPGITKLIKGQGGDAFEKHEQSIGGSSRVCLQFIIALSAKNIKQKIITPSKKLNKKRLKKGKLPFFDYRVLDIHVPALEHTGSPFSKNYQNKVRSHLCRGHFKKRKAGVFWWDAHMRGQKELGVIEKDYRVVKS